MKEKFNGFMIWLREYIWAISGCLLIGMAIGNILTGDAVESYCQTVIAFVCVATQWILDEIKNIRFKF